MYEPLILDDEDDESTIDLHCFKVKKDNNKRTKVKIDDIKKVVEVHEEVMNLGDPSSWEIVANEVPIRGMKRSHEYDNFESNKKKSWMENLGTHHSNLQIVIVAPPLRGWIEIKKKKRSKKDHYHMMA